MRIIVPVVAGLVLTVLAVSSCIFRDATSIAVKQSELAKRPIVLADKHTSTVSGLLEEYHRDSVLFTQNYSRYDLITVPGITQSITTTEGAVVVVLVDETEKNATLRCCFDMKKADTLSELHVSDPVEITGTYDVRDGELLLDSCSLPVDLTDVMTPSTELTLAEFLAHMQEDNYRYHSVYFWKNSIKLTGGVIESITYTDGFVVVLKASVEGSDLFLRCENVQSDDFDMAGLTKGDVVDIIGKYKMNPDDISLNDCVITGLGETTSDV